MRWSFAGPVLAWRGPAPHHFVALPPDVVDELAGEAASVSYGWGVVPVRARVGGTAFTTSLIPREGGYLLPLKAAVRLAEGIALGDEVAVQLDLDR